MIMRRLKTIKNISINNEYDFLIFLDKKCHIKTKRKKLQKLAYC